jgi:hypothetical protein
VAVRGLRRAAGQLPGRFRVVQAGLQEEGCPACGGDVLDDLLAALLVTAGYQDPGAEPGQRQRGGPADPARRAGYQGGPPGQLFRLAVGMIPLVDIVTGLAAVIAAVLAA